MNIACALLVLAALVGCVCAVYGGVTPGDTPGHASGPGVGSESASPASDVFGSTAQSAELDGYYPYYPRLQVDDSLKEGFMNIPIDHFSNDAQVGEFKMQYVERWDLFKSGGPIYILITEHLEADKVLLRNGLLPELATETHGVLYGIEPRFSGAIPRSYYKYLTTKQLLNDVAKFITIIKDKKELIHSKVAIVGTGFFGRLAYWLRRDFSKLVDVAITDVTQPQLHLEDPSKMKTITELFLKNGGQACVKHITDRLEHHRTLLTQQGGAEDLRKSELLCPGTHLADKAQWYTYNAVIYSQLISALSLESYTFNNNICNNIKQLPDFTNVDYCFILPAASHWINRTNYLQCNEYGLFATFNATGAIPLELPLQWYIDMCQQNYGDKFNLDYIKAQVEKTNKAYAGNVTNVAYLSENGPVTLKKGNGYVYPGRTPQNWEEYDAINNFKSSVTKLVSQKYYRSIDQYSFFSPTRTV